MGMRDGEKEGTYLWAEEDSSESVTNTFLNSKKL